MTPPRRRRPPIVLAAVALAATALAACGQAGGGGTPAPPAAAGGGSASGSGAGAGAGARDRTARLAFATSGEIPLPPRPADCIPRVGNPYQFGAVGTITGGSLTLDGAYGVEASVNGITGTLCAVATVVSPPPGSGSATVCVAFTAPADGLSFAPLTANLTLIPGQVTSIGHVTVAATSVSATICNNGVPGPLVLHTVVAAAADAHLFGATCGIAVAVPVEGIVEGPLDNPQQPATGTITNLPFGVPALVPSPTCPVGLTSKGNVLLGLPTPVGAAHLSVSVSIVVYIQLS